jgi:hypothetical protein
MAISANTLAQTAQSLMDQLNANTITFQSYRDSMNSVIQSANNNPDFIIEDNQSAAHTVNIAIRLTKGEDSQPRRR